MPTGTVVEIRARVSQRAPWSSGDDFMTEQEGRRVENASMSAIGIYLFSLAWHNRVTACKDAEHAL